MDWLPWMDKKICKETLHWIDQRPERFQSMPSSTHISWRIYAYAPVLIKLRTERTQVPHVFLVFPSYKPVCVVNTRLPKILGSWRTRLSRHAREVYKSACLTFRNRFEKQSFSVSVGSLLMDFIVNSSAWNEKNPTSQESTLFTI